MTKVIKLRYKCPNCGKEYLAQTYFSNYSKLPKPELQQPVCPYCGTHYHKDEQ